MQKLDGTLYIVTYLVLLLVTFLFFACLVPALLAAYPPLIHLLTGGRP